METDEHGYRAQQRQSAIAYGTRWEPLVEDDEEPLPRQYKYVVCTVAGTAVVKDTAGAGDGTTFDMEANGILPVIPTYLLEASTGEFIGIIE